MLDHLSNRMGGGEVTPRSPAAEDVQEEPMVALLCVDQRGEHHRYELPRSLAMAMAKEFKAAGGKVVWRPTAHA